MKNTNTVFNITFEKLSTNHQWSTDFYFDTIDEAKEYLAENGFYKKNGHYYKDGDNWLEKHKAYISPLKKYKK